MALQELVLTENYLQSLPSSLGNLVHLTNLNVDRNRLEAIPPQIGNLVNLGVMSLRENMVRKRKVLRKIAARSPSLIGCAQF